MKRLSTKDVLIDAALELQHILGGKDSKSCAGFIQYQLHMKEAITYINRICWAAQVDDRDEMMENYDKLKTFMKKPGVSFNK